MNLQSKLKFALLAVAIALVPAAIPASAQQLYKGTFTVPFETKWGNTAMEAVHDYGGTGTRAEAGSSPWPQRVGDFRNSVRHRSNLR